MATDSGWVRSSACSTHSCIEVRLGMVIGGRQIIMVRSTDEGDFIQAYGDEWAAFIKGVKAGEFDMDTLTARKP